MEQVEKIWAPKKIEVVWTLSSENVLIASLCPSVTEHSYLYGSSYNSIIFREYNVVTITA